MKFLRFRDGNNTLQFRPASTLLGISNTVDGEVQLFFDKGLLTFRKNKKEIWFNTPSNKTRMLVVPFNEDPLYLATSYLQSDEGIDSLKMLENLVEG